MSSPVSSGGFLVVQEGLQGFVLGGVVGEVVLPAVPDDVEPGSGEDAYGVGVVVSAGAGLAVEVVGPGVGAAGVSGEVGDGVAQVFVTGPSETDRSHRAGLASRGRDTGQAGQRFGSGEAASAVSDLGEKFCSPDGSGSRQAGEDVRIGVGGQLVGDLVGQDFDLVDEGVTDNACTV